VKRDVANFAQLCGGRYEGPSLPWNDVCSDTRALQAGQLYLALRGPRFDGNEFVAQAAAAGAVAAVVDRPGITASLPLVHVADVQSALTAAAAGWRRQYPGTMVGIAGSNGKTTTKEMTAAILARSGSCLATRGNLNNHIGMPLTLLRLQESDRYAVIEMGANRAGDVAELVAVAKPCIGLITNAGAEHLEGFGDLQGVARAEGEMVAGLPSSATAVINADDEFAKLWRSMTAAQVVSFGLTQAADFHATDIVEALEPQGFAQRFTLHTPFGRVPVLLNLGGRHNVCNAVAAAAAAVSAGASLQDVADGLATLQPVQGRLQPRRSSHGATLIDDTYNANPDSVRAGIDVVAALGTEAWLVLADMGELGDHARDSHIEVGAYARAAGITRLFATGELSRLAADAFGSGASWYADVPALTAAVDAQLREGVSVLVKGSRFNRLERVVATLTGTAASTEH
jgi:UDP-N-acetylmuramoyl-tripeptide--D-alanyl-D-alanine ligase